MGCALIQDDWCHYRKRELWTQKLTHRKNRRHKDTLGWLYTLSWWEWLGCTVVSELWAFWSTSFQCLEFQMLHQGRHRGEAFPGPTFQRTTSSQVPRSKFSLPFGSSIQITVTNMSWLKTYYTRRGPLTRIFHWRRLLTKTSSMPTGWIDCFQPILTTHSLYILEDTTVLDPQNQTVAIFTWNTNQAQLMVVEKVGTQ